MRTRLLNLARSSARRAVPADVLRAIAAECDEARFLVAESLARPFERPDGWAGTDARILGARLAHHLGAPRLASFLGTTAWREDRSHAAARLCFARIAAARRGPWYTLQFLDRTEPANAPQADAAVEAETAALRAYLYAIFRDFDQAARWISFAHDRHPNDPWIFVQESCILERQDRPEEALESASRALRLRRMFRPAVQQAARLCVAAGRDEEALTLLQAAVSASESCLVVQQLIEALSEMEETKDLPALLEMAEARMPWAEPAVQQWLIARRAEVLHRVGDRDGALEWAARITLPGYERFCRNLAKPSLVARRIRLEVPYVRQDRDTCAPATLAAVAAYWGRPVPQDAIADKICYDGTAAHSQRSWAEKADFLAREFRVTMGGAIALIEHGIPFTVATLDATSAHLQAVVGFDRIRESLLIREPGCRHFVEVAADMFLERHAAFGPRGMIMVPQAESHRLDGIDLPDAPLYDLLHDLEKALDRHDRSAAVTLARRMEHDAPDHRLSIAARLTIADYDNNPIERLHCLAALLERHRDDPRVRLLHLGALEALERPRTVLKTLGEMAGRAGTDPVFHVKLALALLADARAHRRAKLLLKIAVAKRPDEPIALSTLARYHWRQREEHAALALFRLAACCGEKAEHHAWNYFMAARHLNETDAALRFLHHRWERFRGRSAGPGITFHESLRTLGRHEDARAVLEQSLKARPEDPELLLYGVADCSRTGYPEHAQAFLDAAAPVARRADWIRASASLAARRNDRGAQTDAWRQLLSIEPLAMDAHESLAALITDSEGPMAALAYWENLSRRFPNCLAIAHARLAAARQVSDEIAETHAGELVSWNPSDAWGHRELALILADLRRYDEADREAAIAMEIEPESPSSFGVRGVIHREAGRIDEASADIARAVELDPDIALAGTELFLLAKTDEDRRGVLDFLYAQQYHNGRTGEAFATYRDLASGVIDSGELLLQIEAMVARFPESLPVRMALVRQHLERREAAKALEAARSMVARFPFVPDAWMELAAAQEALDHADETRAALERALELDPDRGLPYHRLGLLRERAGDGPAAITLLDSAATRIPRDPVVRLSLASMLWRNGRRDDALVHLHAALQLAPSMAVGWEMLRDWCGLLSRPGHPREFARHLTQERPGDPAAWLAFAGCITDGRGLAESHAAVERALELNPRLAPAWDLKARLFAFERRLGDAIACCEAPIWKGRPPAELEMRRAHLTASRGEPDGAIQLLRALLERVPAHAPAWQLLSRIELGRGQIREARASALQAARLRPSAAAWVNLAEIEMGANNAPGARQAFEAALANDPDDAAAHVGLITFEMSHGQIDAATAMLTKARTALDEHLALGLQTRLDIQRGRRAEAVTGFNRLARQPQIPEEYLREVWEAAALHGMAEPFAASLEQLVWQPGVHLEIARLWVRRRIKAGHWDIGDSLATLPQEAGFRREALALFLDSVGENRAGRRVLPELLARHRGILRADDLLWGKAGFALCASGMMGETAAWLTDWREHENVEPWMLNNLAAALDATDRDDEAAEVSAHVVQQGLRDHTLGPHQVRAAIRAALHGDTQRSADLIANVSRDQLDSMERIGLLMIEGLLAHARAPAQEKRAIGHARWEEINRAASAQPVPAHVRRALVRCKALLRGTIDPALKAGRDALAPRVRRHDKAKSSSVVGTANAADPRAAVYLWVSSLVVLVGTFLCVSALGSMGAYSTQTAYILNAAGAVLAAALAVTSLSRCWKPRAMPVIALFVAVLVGSAMVITVFRTMGGTFAAMSLPVARLGIGDPGPAVLSNPDIYRSPTGLIEVDMGKFPMAGKRPELPSANTSLEGVTIGTHGNAYVTILAGEFRARSHECDVSLDNAARHFVQTICPKGSNPTAARTRSGYEIRRSLVPNTRASEIAAMDVTLTNGLAIVVLGAWRTDSRGPNEEMESLLEKAWSSVRPGGSPAGGPPKAPLPDFRSAGGARYFYAPGGYLSMRMDGLPGAWVENFPSPDVQQPNMTRINLPDPARILISYSLIPERFLVGSTTDDLLKAVREQIGDKDVIATAERNVGKQKYIRLTKQIGAAREAVILDTTIFDGKRISISTGVPSTGNPEGDTRVAHEIADRVLSVISLHGTGGAGEKPPGFVARFVNSEVACASDDIPAQTAEAILSIFRTLKIAAGQPGRAVVSLEGEMLVVETQGKDTLVTDSEMQAFFARVASSIQEETWRGKPVEVRILDGNGQPRLVAAPADLGRPLRRESHFVFVREDAFEAPARRLLDWLATTPLKDTYLAMQLRRAEGGPIEFCFFTKPEAEKVPEYMASFRAVHHGACQFGFPDQPVKLLLTDADFKTRVAMETAVWESRPQGAPPPVGPATTSAPAAAPRSP